MSDWIVNLTTAQPLVSTSENGNILVLGSKARFPELIKSYSSRAELIADGFLASDLEALAMAAYDIQAAAGPVAPTIKVGRRTHLPTPVVTVTPTSHNSKIYRMYVNGQVASYTSAASTSVGAIITGLLAAIAALAPDAWVISTHYDVGGIVKNDTGKIYTCISAGTSAGSGGPTGTGVDITDGDAHWAMTGVVPTAVDNTSNFTLTSPVAGERLSVSVDDNPLYIGHAGLAIEYAHGDPGIALDLDAILATDPDFFGLVLTDASVAEVVAAATWAEAQNVLLLAESNQTAVLTTPNANVQKTLLTASRAHTHFTFQKDPSEFYSLKLAVNRFAYLAGSESWAWVNVAGSTRHYFTTTHRTNLATNNVNYSMAITSTLWVHWEGKTPVGGWADLQRGYVWFKSYVTNGLINLQIAVANDVTQGKLAYTDDGIVALEGVLRDAVREGSSRNFLTKENPVVTRVLAADVSAAVKSTRRYSGLTLRANLGGAIHGGTLNINLAA